MAHYGILGTTAISETAEDIRGASLYGRDDDKLGKIDDVIFDHATGDIRYVVVDTGGWLSSKKFIVPAERLRASAKHENDFEADLTKKQVENFPPYKDSDLESESKWTDYEGKYRAKWVTDPVMHRAETDRNITPTTYQETGNLNSERAEAEAQGRPVPVTRMPAVSTSSREADLEAASRPTDRIIPAGSDTVVVDSTAAGVGQRWDTFQSRLREHRKEAVAACHTCTGSSAKRPESAGELRKAV
jgi:sporulation protein YlmC with PRC-barrel domain